MRGTFSQIRKENSSSHERFSLPASVKLGQFMDNIFRKSSRELKSDEVEVRCSHTLTPLFLKLSVGSSIRYVNSRTRFP